MTVLKCKMCSGDLIVVEGQSTAECEFCGSLQTIPNLDDEKKLVQFERAERLRKHCEFDKAAGIYESIVADFRQEAEAYWGLVLCKYGIEYVDDPATGKKIPTCHRTSFDSILEDSDFEQAQENATDEARNVYRKEAKAIEDLRKDIIAVSANEEPYDIFICYKETASNGERTLDSVLAQDIYDTLTDKGYRVFFARITLEDKLGVEYEPLIFAALNSSRIMLAIGTEFDYFNAVWVKNEWSRYLKLMAKDKGKHLIPCYKGIDAYDIPKEFAKLQAQDLGKVGAMQDLLRGIEKIIPRATETTAAADSPSIESLLKRSQMYLEDGDWRNAIQYCEKVLDIEPENPYAYMGKLMAERQAKNQDALKLSPTPLDSSPNYQKVLRFGDASMKKLLEEANSHIITRNENARLKAAYDKATSVYNSAGNSPAKYRDAANLFAGISQYKDAAAQQEKCIKKAAEVQAALDKAHEADRQAALNRKNKNTRIAIIASIAACVIIAAVVLVITVVIPAMEYNKAIDLKNAGKYGQAALELWEIGDYKDAREQCLDAWAKAGVRETVSAGHSHSVCVKTDSTVEAAGVNDDGQCNVAEWTDIIAVSAGYSHTVGLKADGTVVATGSNKDGECNVSEWTDIVAISAGENHTIGLKMDGTVLAIGANKKDQCSVTEWTDIIAISASYGHTVGLKANGTVIATSTNYDMNEWADIVAISASERHTIALQADGTVVADGAKGNGRIDVSEWTDIVAISAGYSHTVGLKADGTVVTTDNTQNASEWTNIIAISAGNGYTIGLNADGTIVATGLTVEGYDWENIVSFAGEKLAKDSGNIVAALQADGTALSNTHDLSDWTDIVDVATVYDRTIGLKADGTIVTTGESSWSIDPVLQWTDIASICAGPQTLIGIKENGTVVAFDNGKPDLSNIVAGWTNITDSCANSFNVYALNSNGTVVSAYSESELSSWRDIVAISAGNSYVVGLKSDGTVVATGDNSHGQCNVSSWSDIVAISANSYYTIALKSDGTIISTGDNDVGQRKTTGWHNVIAIEAAHNATYGLLEDGTIIATGNSYFAKLPVANWKDVRIPD